MAAVEPGVLPLLAAEATDFLAALDCKGAGIVPDVDVVLVGARHFDDELQVADEEAAGVSEKLLEV